MTLSTIGSFRAAFYTALIFLYGTLANILFVLIGALVLPFSPSTAYELISQVAYGLWASLQYLFEDVHSGKITFSGDELPSSQESAFILANHLSYGDFFLVQALAWRQQMLPYCRYFVKHSLVWTLPVYGLALYLSGMIMVKRHWVTDQRLAAQAFARIKRLKAPIWLVSYLEGTRMSPKKKSESQDFAKKRDLPVLDHVLLPRSKGFVAAVSELRDSHVKHVYDLTLVYGGPNGVQDAPRFWDILGTPRLSPQYAFHVHVKRYELASLPSDEQGLTNWLMLRWQEKDEYLNSKVNLWARRRSLQE